MDLIHLETATNQGGPLDIISLNYDTCIEQFCNVQKMTCQDGFDLYWNPETFNKVNTDVHLYKLHGSIIWYQSESGSYLKLPIQSGKGEIKLIYGEKAENLMLYPMQKWDYVEPLLELLLRAKYLLESRFNPDILIKDENVDSFEFLIAVGYSFRDDHIKKIIWDAAKNNRDLYLVIIDPEADKIYQERLRYCDDSRKNASNLENRVVCLPYTFEGVFPFLKKNI